MVEQNDKGRRPAPATTSAAATTYREPAAAGTLSAFHVEQAARAAAPKARRSAPVSYEDVEKAAKKLQERGEKPGIRNVRAEVGGAPETIMKFMNQWRDAERTALRASGDGIGESLQLALLREFEARRQAGAAEVQEHLAQQMESVEELDAELQRTRETISEQAQTIEALHSELAQAHQELEVQSRAAASAHEQLARESEAQNARYDALRAELTEVRDDLVKTRCRAEAEADRAQNLKAENDRLRTDSVEARLQLGNAREAMAAAKQTAAVATTKLEGLTEQLSIVRDDLKQARSRTDDALEQAKASYGQARTAEDEKEQLRRKLDAAHAELAHRPPADTKPDTVIATNVKGKKP